jgi:hypothetical protein
MITRRGLLVTAARASSAIALPLVLTACGGGGAGVGEVMRQIAGFATTEGGFLAIDNAGNTLLVSAGVNLAWRT